MVFASTKLVRRVESAEITGLAALIAVAGEGAWGLAIGEGLASYCSDGSPFNKVAGLGFSSVTERDFDEVERRYTQVGASVQIELSTHGDPGVANRLIGRGYRLTGFENVIGCQPNELSFVPAPQDIVVRQAEASEIDAWCNVLIDGALTPDDGEPVAEHNDFARPVLERAYQTMAHEPTLTRWLARIEGRVIGGATMGVRDRIATLVGAATLPMFRRRGVQTALLHARLGFARDMGCELAVVTTQPGSKSQQNAQRAGFTLLYSRAIWVREPLRRTDARRSASGYVRG